MQPLPSLVEPVKRWGQGAPAVISPKVALNDLHGLPQHRNPSHLQQPTG